MFKRKEETFEYIPVNTIIEQAPSWSFPDWVKWAVNNNKIHINKDCCVIFDGTYRKAELGEYIVHSSYDKFYIMSFEEFHKQFEAIK